jgi:hypothetical protein
MSIVIEPPLPAPPPVVDPSQIRTEADLQAVFGALGNSLVRDLLAARADAHARGALKPTDEILADIAADQGASAQTE